jgi:PAS domain S-box-containing protein
MENLPQKTEDPIGAAAERVRLSEIRFRRLFEAAHDGVLILDPLSRKISEANPFIADLLGYTREELLGKELWQIGLVKDEPASHAAFRKLQEKGQIRYEDLPLETKSGEKREVEVVANHYEEDGNQVIQCNIRDITERKRNEKVLKELSDQLATELAAAQRLQETSTLLIQEGNTEALYRQILDAGIVIMRSDMSSLQMLDDGQGALRMLASRGFDPTFAQTFEWVRPDAKTSCSAAWRSGHRVVVPDVETCDFIAGTTALEEHRKAGIRAVQSTPLVSRSGRLIGMISNHWRQPHQPAERELRLLDVLARQAADLIERKETEGMRARLAAIVESSKDAIMSKSINGIISSWNNGAERLFGYTAQEAIGQPVTMLIPPDGFNEEASIIERVRRGESVEHYETVRRRKDGTLIDISLTVSPLRDGEGGIAGASKIARDITERKQAEEALRASEERYRALFDFGPVAVYSCDAFGVIQKFNPRAGELWGREPAVGDTDERFCGSFKLFRPDGSFMPHDQCPMAEVVSGKVAVVRDAEVIIERPDGSQVVVIVNIRPLKNERGEVTGAVNCFYDITERKKGEEALRLAQAQLAERAGQLEQTVAERTEVLRTTVAELEAFSYSIVHDMRAPLRAMQSFAKILADDCAPQVGPEGKDYIRRIITSADRMDKLIQDVLSYSQVARKELRIERVDVEKLLRGMLESYPLFQPPNAEVQVEGRLPEVMANEAALTQCFSNLIGNAVKFVRPGRAPRVRVWAESKDDRVRLLVQDNGIGIAKDAQQRIFGIFQRLSKQYEGTGIGLAIVRKAVERMGGQAGLRSEPGQGSTFWVELRQAP